MYEFTCSGPVAADLRVGTGSATIVAEERTSVTVDVRPGNGSDAARTAAENTTVEFSGDTLLVATPELRGLQILWRNAPVDITVHVPAGGRLGVRTATADVACSGRFGATDVNTASGDVTVDEIVGDLRCNTASGDVRVGTVTGPARLATASGDLRADRISGDLTAKSASGDVRVGEIGGSVQATTASGDIEIAAMRTGEARMSSVSGDLVVGVAEGTAVWMDLSTLSGRSTSELPVGDTPTASGSPQLSVHGKTVSGNLTIRRAWTAATVRG